MIIKIRAYVKVNSVIIWFFCDIFLSNRRSIQTNREKVSVRIRRSSLYRCHCLHRRTDIFSYHSLWTGYATFSRTRLTSQLFRWRFQTRPTVSAWSRWLRYTGCLYSKRIKLRLNFHLELHLHLLRSPEICSQASGKFIKRIFPLLLVPSIDFIIDQIN